MTTPTNNQQNKASHSAVGLIVLNPTAGDGEAGKLREKLREVLGAKRFDLLELEEGLSLCAALQKAVQERDYQWIAAAGGDGTVSNVGSCLVDLDLPLAIIPAGTGNAIAGALGIPEDIEQACRLLLNDPAKRTLDAIKVNDHYYFLQVGVGIEALTMQETSSDQKNKFGDLAYLWTAAKEAIDWQPQHFQLTIDGEEHTLEASELVLANIGDVGLWGMRWGKHIEPDDGTLDVVAINVQSTIDYAQVVPALARGTQADSDMFTYFSARDKVSVETKRPLPIHGDGEELENPWPLEARLIPNALTVIVPH